LAPLLLALLCYFANIRNRPYLSRSKSKLKARKLGDKLDGMIEVVALALGHASEFSGSRWPKQMYFIDSSMFPAAQETSPFVLLSDSRSRRAKIDSGRELFRKNRGRLADCNDDGPCYLDTTELSPFLSAHVCPLLLDASCGPYMVLVTRYCHLLAISVS